MPAVMSPNPKKVRVFIHNGKLYEGGPDTFYNPGANLGGAGQSDGVLPTTEANSEKEAE